MMCERCDSLVNVGAVNAFAFWERGFPSPLSPIFFVMLSVIGMLVMLSLVAGSSVPPPPGGRPPSSGLVVSVDVGTESTRAAVFDAQGALLGSAAAPHATAYPLPGWAEQVLWSFGWVNPGYR